VAGIPRPWVPIIFALSAFGIVIDQVLAEAVDSAVGPGLVIIGRPAYHVWFRKSYRPGLQEEAR